MSNRFFPILCGLLFASCSNTSQDRVAVENSNDRYAATVLEAKGIDGRPLLLSAFPADKKADTSNQVAAYVTAMLQDAAGTLWFGTEEKGLVSYSDTILHYFTEKDGYWGSHVRSLKKDRSGHLWIATNAGLLEYDGKNFKRYTVEQGLPSNEVWSVGFDCRGRVWCGTQEGLCVKLSQSFEKVPLPVQGATSPSRFNRQLVYSILEDWQGYLWFGTDGGGLIRYDGNEYVQFLKKDGLSDEVITTLLEDSHHRLWVGTMWGGLVVREKGRFHVLGSEKGLYAEGVWSLMEDHKGRVWAGTLGGGAAFYDGEQFYSYLEKRGKTRNMVISMLETKSHRIYMGLAGGGLYEFNGETLINRKRQQLGNCIPESEKLFPRESPVNFVY